MRIGIDARLINETGVGRYIRNLIEQLGRLDNRNEYIVFLTSDTFDSFILPNKRWKKRLADVRWHTIREQLVMPILFLRDKLDIVHIPYFNVPIFYPKKFIVTIHDVIILHFNTGRATTLPWVLYQSRRLGYWLVHAIGLARAKKILAVSSSTKQELMDHFRVDPKKIAVTYEGVNEKIKSLELRVKNEKSIIKAPYLLYVGNAYPHKNLEALLQAFRQVATEAKLVLVGRDDFFYRRLRDEVARLKLTDRVEFFGEANDKQLASLYANANALVFPSLMEGFGLPTLEALANGCPVICSDIPVFHEILGDMVYYVDPKNISSIAQALTRGANGELAKPDLGAIKSLLSRYSWETMTRQTLDTYERVGRPL